MSSYVYAIRAGDFFKVGKADNPDGRISGFRTGCPHPIVPITTIEVKDAALALSIEGYLHRELREMGLWHEREWFRWSPAAEAALLAIGTKWESSIVYDPHRSSGPSFSNIYGCLVSQYLTASIGRATQPPDRVLHFSGPTMFGYLDAPLHLCPGIDTEWFEQEGTEFFVYPVTIGMIVQADLGAGHYCRGMYIRYEDGFYKLSFEDGEYGEISEQAESRIVELLALDGAS